MVEQAPFLVCFGDSLTAGYQITPGGFGDAEDTPPGGFLQEWIGSRAFVDVTGICGEVTTDMVTRFPQDVVSRNPQIVVILGGTNDLGWNVPSSQICSNLQQMYRMALDAGIQPVGVTVPSIYGEESGSAGMPSQDQGFQGSLPAWVRSHIDARFILNRLIREACQDLGMICLDLFTETADGPAHLLDPKLSCDGLHFNTAGYEAFARLIWRQVLASTFGDFPNRQ